MSNHSERRQEPRYKKEVDIIIFCGKHFFRTKTVDLSDGGCQLKSPIPCHFEKHNLEVVFTGGENGSNAFQMLKGFIVNGDRTRLALNHQNQSLSSF